MRSESTIQNANINMDKKKIRLVEINKLWGVKSIACPLNNDVNIIIGSNGSGKTTFLKIIEAVLLCDVPVLSSIQFESVVVYLEGGDNCIRVIQTPEDDTLNLTLSLINSSEPTRLCRIGY